MSLRSVFIALSSLFSVFPVHAYDQSYNFKDRKAVVLNTCPHLELSGLSFGNNYADRGRRFEQHLSWKNVGEQPIVAFEIVVLKYDAFDQREVGSRWVVTGKNSADWSPLEPGESDSDGTIGYGSEEVFTAIAYVRSARLADGTIWRVNDAKLNNDLRAVAPGIKDFGSVKPDPKSRKSDE